MPVLLAVAVLCFMQIVGEALARFTGLPLHRPLLGMLLMLAALLAYGRVPVGLRNTCHHLLKHLMLLFIPLVAGLMGSFCTLERAWIPFLLALMVGVALTLVVSALSLQWRLKVSKGRGRTAGRE